MKKTYAVLFTAGLFLNLQGSFGQIEIILRKSFADSIKDRVSITTDYVVKFSHERPNPPSKDGDLHIAGWASGIGLPVVAEIMNAKYQPGAVKMVHQNQESGDPLRITGVWRFWCEHTVSGEVQEQDGDHPDITSSNPPHVFEFHPLLMINDADLTSTLAPIAGFRYKDADDAFNKYSKAKCIIEDLGKTVRITTGGVGYNYAEFWIGLLEAPKKSPDGSIASCVVMNRGKKMIYSKMRMIFPEGSKAETKLEKMKKGDNLHVLGIPRINLNEVMTRVANAGTNPSLLSLSLPVEMIIVADLPEE